MTTPAPSSLVLNVSLDKASYKPGDTITVTADLLQIEEMTVTVSGTTSAGTTVNGTGTGNVEAPVAGTFGISDSLSSTWSQVSNADGVAVFTATLPAAAAA